MKFFARACAGRAVLQMRPRLRDEASGEARESTAPCCGFLTLAAGIFLLLLAGCTVPGLNRFGRVEYKGQVIYRFEQPDTNALHTLRALGVRKIVNLRNDPQPWEKPYVESLGMVYVSIPLSGVLAPTTAQEEIVQQNLDAAPGPVGVHCKEGKDRTGTALACWEIRRGLDPTTARLEADRWGLSVGAMRRFIESYRP